ncbi:MAG: hypothetical protein ACFFAN_12540 [Promethearchaeota archaeon]
MKYERFLALIAIIVIISTISFISLYMIINTSRNIPPDNIPPVAIITESTDQQGFKHF